MSPSRAGARVLLPKTPARLTDCYAPPAPLFFVLIVLAERGHIWVVLRAWRLRPIWRSIWVAIGSQRVGVQTACPIPVQSTARRQAQPIDRRLVRPSDRHPALQTARHRDRLIARLLAQPNRSHQARPIPGCNCAMPEHGPMKLPMQH